MDPYGKQQSSLKAALTALRGTVLAANKLVPGVVPAVFLVAGLVIIVSLLSVRLMIGVTTLVVVFAAVFVYVKSNDYAQALLALVVGLLTSFTVDWTAGRFVVFCISWVGLLTLIMLISSVRIASKVEAILVFAAQFVELQDLGVAKDRLETISKDQRVRSLGPVERAEIIRVFAIRKVPLDVMGDALSSTDVFSAITGIGHKTVAEFVADLYMLTRPIDEQAWNKVLDMVYDALRSGTSSPDEFIDAFSESRRIALSGQLDFATYFSKLSEGMIQGVPAKEMYDYMRQK